MNRERALARFLHYVVFVCGLVFLLSIGLSFAGTGSAEYMATLGIVLLISLPVMRVAVVGVMFFVDHDYFYAAVSLVVLLLLVFGFIVGAGEI